jgi:hypothetical protein
MRVGPRVRAIFATRTPPPFRATSVPVSLRKESKRGLIALAVLCVVGLVTFASVASSGSFGNRAKDAVAARLKHAQ